MSLDAHLLVALYVLDLIIRQYKTEDFDAFSAIVFLILIRRNLLLSEQTWLFGGPATRGSHLAVQCYRTF